MAEVIESTTEKLVSFARREPDIDKVDPAMLATLDPAFHALSTEDKERLPEAWRKKYAASTNK